MLSYQQLQHKIPDQHALEHTCNNLLSLRTALAKTIPRQTTDETLILGTWNIRNFDDNRFGHDPRLEESFFYIAEIIAAFDVIAIQELNVDTEPLEKLMRILGPDYSFLITDATEGSAGNSERLGFIYNTRKVTFTGVAGEIVLPSNLLISRENHKRQFSRTPFCVSMQSGWFKFMFATVHIYYGSNSKSSSQYKARIDEIQTISDFLFKRANQEQHNYILVGDFNIDSLGDDAYNALEASGFKVFKNRMGSNNRQNKYFDQISYVEKPGEVELARPYRKGIASHGVFNFFDILFTDKQFDYYDPTVEASLSHHTENTVTAIDTKNSSRDKRLNYYRDVWRTFQLSDHYPLWVALKVDFTDDYLAKISTG